jgi:Ca2+/Na+ antiporter
MRLLKRLSWRLVRLVLSMAACLFLLITVAVGYSLSRWTQMIILATLAIWILISYFWERNAGQWRKVSEDWQQISARWRGMVIFLQGREHRDRN